MFACHVPASGCFVCECAEDRRTIARSAKTGQRPDNFFTLDLVIITTSNFGANPPTYSSRAVVSDEVTLRIHLLFAFPSTYPFVAPVGPQTAGLHVVSQAHIQHFFLQMFPESWVLDGRNQLDAPVQVSLHPIRTANVDVFFASVKEI